VSGLLKSVLFHRARGSRRLGGGKAGMGSDLSGKDTVLQCPSQVRKAGTWIDSHTASWPSAKVARPQDGH